VRCHVHNHPVLFPEPEGPGRLQTQLEYIPIAFVVSKKQREMAKTNTSSYVQSLQGAERTARGTLSPANPGKAHANLLRSGTCQSIGQRNPSSPACALGHVALSSAPRLLVPPQSPVVPSQQQWHAQGRMSPGRSTGSALRWWQQKEGTCTEQPAAVTGASLGKVMLNKNKG